MSPNCEEVKNRLRKTSVIEVEMLPPIILCIDDRPEMLNIRKTSLQRLGYQVETASNVTNAITAAATLPISVVLLDYKLEGMDAQAFAHQLKQRFPALPIILLSAYSEMPAALLWLVDEYVMKSEPVERLSDVIDKVVSVKKVIPRSDVITRRFSASGLSNVQSDFSSQGSTARNA